MKEDPKISRRDFFRFGLRKGGHATGKAVMAGIRHKFKRKAVRPPGALPEEEFLVSCTRCGKCTDVCPGAIRTVDAMTGGVLAGTPFIDPYTQPCIACEDTPCVSVCTPGALRLEPGKPIPPGSLGTAVVEAQHCLIKQGQICDYCFKSCPSGIKAIGKTAEGLPEIDESACIGCGKCAYICVSQTGKAIRIRPAGTT